MDKMCLQYSNFSFCMQNIFSPLLFFFLFIFFCCHRSSVWRTHHMHSYIVTERNVTWHNVLWQPLKMIWMYRQTLSTIGIVYERRAELQGSRKMLCEKYAKICATHFVYSLSSVHFGWSLANPNSGKLDTFFLYAHGQWIGSGKSFIF